MTIPDVLLERYLLDEVTDAERAAIEADPGTAARLEALRAHDRAILGSVDAEQFAREVRARRSPRRAPIAVLGTVFALAAALLLWVLVVPQTGDRAKGSAQLLVYVQTAEGAHLLGEGEALQAGDVVQLGYVPARATHGVIVSIDGAGGVTLHHADALQPAKAVLPTAFELDDAPRFERFFLVTDERPVDSDRVLEAARALAASPGALTGALDLAVDQTDRVVLKR